MAKARGIIVCKLIKEPKVAKKNGESGLNWDVLGIASLGVTVFGAAVFYVAGWIYESHWCAYFGIDADLLSLQPQAYMTRGVVGVVSILLISLTIAIPWLSLSKDLQKSLEDIIHVVPVCVGIFLAAPRAILNIITQVPITLDVWVLAIILTIWSFFVLFAYLRDSNRRDSQGDRTIYNWSLLCYVAIFFLLSSITVSAMHGEYEAKSGKSLFPHIDRELPVSLITDSRLPDLISVETIVEGEEGENVSLYRYEGLSLLTVTEDDYCFLEGDRKGDFVVHAVPKKIVRQLILGRESTIGGRPTADAPE